MAATLPIDAILDSESPPRPQGPGLRLGTSREGRDIVGYRIGDGRQRVSLIAGCHADEPVGPAMLDRLVAYLEILPADAPLLSETTFFVVPHTNPDGEAKNAAWARPAIEQAATTDLGSYLRGTVRELPGDDVEFGFPRSEDDVDARPENRAVAELLRRGAPFSLHASFHGMAFAAGPWFLLESAWIDRTAAMRKRLRERVRELGYRLHDVDRGGEKGFTRIDEGFTTRPDSQAMVAYFEAIDDPETAALFRPSSMEYVRSLGGDPLTLVSEMPLFVMPPKFFTRHLVRPPLLDELMHHAARNEEEVLRARASAAGVQSMPIADQMRLQLAYLAAGLDAAL